MGGVFFLREPKGMVEWTYREYRPGLPLKGAQGNSRVDISLGPETCARASPSTDSTLQERRRELPP